MANTVEMTIAKTLDVFYLVAVGYDIKMKKEDPSGLPFDRTDYRNMVDVMELVIRDIIKKESEESK